MATSAHTIGSISPQAAQIRLRARLADNSSPFGIVGEGEGCGERWEEEERGGGAQAGEDRLGERESGARAEGPDLRRSKLKQIKILGPGRLRETCDTNLTAK
jgi:hypothetical protein